MGATAEENICDYDNPIVAAAAQQQPFVTMSVDGQLFGILVTSVLDVLRAPAISPVPMAPPDVCGSLNLRGRIVTAIDVRARLGLHPETGETGLHKKMCVVIEHANELYGLIVDHVGEVLPLPLSGFGENPANLSTQWKEKSAGVFRLEEALLVVLDVERFFDFGQ